MSIYAYSKLQEENKQMNMNEDKCESRIIHLAKVEEARAASLNEYEIEKLSQLFKTVADPSRIRILSALDRDEMCVCDLAALLGISESAVSHQLRLLRTMGLVTNRREGTVLYYRLIDDHVKILITVGLEHAREKDGE